MTPTRRHVLAALAAAACLPASRGARAQATPPAACAAAAPDTLRRAACRRDIAFGTAVATGDIGADPAYRALVARECAVVVPTWEMKWAQVQPAPGRFDFRAVDMIARFASETGLALRGHTIVWHYNMPDWLSRQIDAASWAGLLERHIAALCGRYPQIRSWDVVNEAVEPDHGRGDGLRDTAWLAAAGFDHISLAFRLAARYAPGAELVYNDYGTEHEERWTRRRRTAILKLLERLRAAGVPVHALGLQAHLRLGDPFSPTPFARFLKEVQDLGVKPIVTEFDIQTDRVAGAARKDQEVARLARAFLETLLANARCDTVITWGLSDKYTWRTQDDPAERPLLHDSALRRKPVYEAVRAVFATMTN